jgi:heat-inducible transcriptional repressor
MQDLTQRQVDILKTIIQEYTETGGPVGSEILEKKYKLGVSPATIRNEMVELEKKGYLNKTHFSSGRVPSSKGYRFYIKNIMKEKELSTVDEVAYKHSIWDERDKEYKMFTQATRVLAQKTGLLSLITTNSGDLYYAGIGNLLNRDAFFQPDTRSIFSRLDEINFWEEILKLAYVTDQDVMFILGQDDFKDPLFESCASVFGEFESQQVKGIVGVIGPKSIRYEDIVPQIRFFSQLIEDIIRENK